MSNALDWISGTGPQHLERFVRLRAKQKPDRYNPDSLVDDWSQAPDELELFGSWSSTSSTVGADAVREQQTTTKQLVIFDPDADVREDDRIRAEDGAVFSVTGRPARDQNPFTGWRPTLVIDLEEGKG